MLDVMEPSASRQGVTLRVSSKNQSLPSNMDYVPPNAQESSNGAHLLIFEDNEQTDLIHSVCMDQILGQ